MRLATFSSSPARYRLVTRSTMTENEQLDKLAQEIRAELGTLDGREAVQHAIAAGERLIKAKRLVERGKWMDWIRNNFPASQPQANRYMSLASNYSRVSKCKTLSEALAAIKPPPKPKAPKPTTETPSKKPRSTEGARRKREIAEERRKAKIAGQTALGNLLKMQGRLAEIVRVLETTDFNADFNLNDVAVNAVMQTADDLVTTIEWCDRALAPVRSRLGVAKTMELIRKLESTDGRSPEEAAAFRRRAELLRRKHGLELAA